MIILVDMDGPITDFEGGFLRSWRRMFPYRPFVELEQRRSVYVVDDYPEHHRKDAKCMYQEPGFYNTLLPVDGAIDALWWMLQRGHQPFICTAPSLSNPTCMPDKYAWVRRWLGKDFVDRIIITRDKTTSRGDFLIDDRPEVLGALSPMWEHVLFDCPANRNNTTKRRIDWVNYKNVLNL